MAARATTELTRLFTQLSVAIQAGLDRHKLDLFGMTVHSDEAHARLHLRPESRPLVFGDVGPSFRPTSQTVRPPVSSAKGQKDKKTKRQRDTGWQFHNLLASAPRRDSGGTRAGGCSRQ